MWNMARRESQWNLQRGKNSHRGAKQGGGLGAILAARSAASSGVNLLIRIESPASAILSALRRRWGVIVLGGWRMNAMSPCRSISEFFEILSPLHYLKNSTT